MEQVLSIIQSYWGIIVVILAFGGYAIFETGKAKQLLLGLMFTVEKNAESLILKTGADKFDMVVTKGYELLPAQVRLFVSKELFKTLAQKIYDETKEYLTKEK